MYKSEKILKSLKKFYSNEASGAGHYEEDLVDLAWSLAEVLEAEGPGNNVWKSDEEGLIAVISELRAKHSVVVIDTVVNHMHQGLLDTLDRSGSDSTNMMYYHEGDIVEYLLNRE